MRLFVAVDLDPALRRRIEDVQRQIYEECMKLIEPENLHVTLKFLGEVDESKVEDIRHRLRKIRVLPFDISFRGIGVFPSLTYIRVIWIGMEGQISELAAKVRAALPTFPDDFEFSAHLTIARVKGKLTHIGDNLQKFSTFEAGTQRVENFSLKKSTLTPHGPVYEDVEVYGLG